MKEGLKNKFNTVKSDVKEAWNKTSEADKTKIQKDIKNRDVSGATDTIKENFRKQGKV